MAALDSQTSTSQQTIQNQRPKSPSQQGTKFSTNSTSKKRNRHRKNKNRANVAPKAQAAPVREYVSLCHGVLAKKKSTGTPLSSGTPKGAGRKQQSDPAQVTGLGGWRCGECGKPCKVKAQAPTVAEVAIAQPNN